MYDIIAIGGVLKDIIFLSEKGETFVNPKEDPLCEKLICFEAGAKEVIKKVFIGFGGGAANTAVGFKKLGFKVGILARVGQDLDGQGIIENFKKLKIATFIDLDRKYSTGFSLISVLKNGRAQTIFTYRGANNRLNFQFSIFNFQTKWFYVASLTTPNWREILDKIISYKLKVKSLKIAWNPGNVQLKAGFKGLKKYLLKTDVLILNEDEARELILNSKSEIRNPKSRFHRGSSIVEPSGQIPNLKIQIPNLLKALYKMGPKIVAITCGKKGAYAIDAKKIYFKKALPVKVANTTGAGDAFSSAFVGSLIWKSKDISQALNWGIKNSASVIKKFGAQNGLLSRREIS